MKRHNQVCIIFLATLACLPARSSHAWNSPGHMIVALIAYDHLDDAAKAKAVALLRAHPRFADHFDRAMDRAARRAGPAEQDQWLFAFAATWPDLVRSAKGGVTSQDVDRYSRPWWHFIDEPVYLNDAEAQKLAPTIHLNRKREAPTDPNDKDMNVIQAIETASTIIGDANAPTDERSIRLCWMLHLVGDAHQPLHSSALFTTHRFPDGDHGGNYVYYGHQYSLHSFWDDQISTDEPYQTVRILAKDLSAGAELAAEGDRAAAQLDPGAWIDEGHELAKKYAYSPEVLQKIAAREGHSHLGELKLSPEYDADAENLAERQAVIAGHRLAKLLLQLLHD